MKTKLEKFIADNSDELDSRMPDPAVLNRILQQIKVKPADQKPKGIVISFNTLRWAAAAIVLVALGLAVYTLTPSKKVPVVAYRVEGKKKITRIQSDPTNETAEQPIIAKASPGRNLDEVDQDIARRKNALMERVSNNNAASRKVVMLTSLRDMESPAHRIDAVAQAGEFKMAGRDVVTALLTTLNSDPNTNVRLAALDGLARFYHETYIRRKLIASLKTQQNPSVQIALIELLTRMKEAAVLDQLDKIVASDSTMTAVKDCAYSGIFKLRKS